MSVVTHNNEEKFRVRDELKTVSLSTRVAANRYGKADPAVYLALVAAPDAHRPGGRSIGIELAPEAAIELANRLIAMAQIATELTRVKRGA